MEGRIPAGFYLGIMVRGRYHGLKLRNSAEVPVGIVIRFAAEISLGIMMRFPA